MLDMGCQPGMRNRVSRHLYKVQYGMELNNVNAFWYVSTGDTIAIDRGFYSGSGISQRCEKEARMIMSV